MIDRFLNNASNEFFLRSGRVLKNVKELALEMDTMDDTTFDHHVNELKNDFHAWIQHSVGDGVLAKRIEKIKDKKKMHRAINARVKQLHLGVKARKTHHKAKTASKNVVHHVKRHLKNPVDRESRRILRHLG